MVTLLTTIVFL